MYAHYTLMKQCGSRKKLKEIKKIYIMHAKYRVGLKMFSIVLIFIFFKICFFFFFFKKKKNYIWMYFFFFLPKSMNQY
jgi:hypothetical protein